MDSADRALSTRDRPGYIPVEMAITRLLGFVGATLGGTIGWYLGAPVGMMTAFVLSIIGTGVGMYLGVKIARQYLA